MKQRITSVKDLPDWFKDKTYKTNLSMIDWFHEIRARQHIKGMLELEKRDNQTPIEKKKNFRENLLALLKNAPRSYLLRFPFVPEIKLPVQDLTAAEALYFKSAILDDDLIKLGMKFDELLSLWIRVFKEEKEHNAVTPLLIEHEYQVTNFFLNDLPNSSYADKLDKPIREFTDVIGNPWMPFRKPLNGTPITVDTQFDDETIIGHFKKWLAEKRKADGSRIRRPFNQNDLDDWDYYKIRQIFDLEMWAELVGVQILDKVIAASLWPYASDDFSPIDVLRTTGRKKVKDIFNWSVVVRLYAQLVLKYGENFSKQ